MSSRSSTRRKRLRRATLQAAMVMVAVTVLLGAMLTSKFPRQMTRTMIVAAAVVGAQMGVYFWGWFAQEETSPKIPLVTEAIALIVVGVLWHILQAGLLGWHAPYKDPEIRRLVGLIVYYVAGLPSLVLGLKFAFRVFDKKFTPLYALALVATLSPAAMFLLVHLAR